MKVASSEGRAIFPFISLVDQERLKLALLLNAINPRIGGVLIRGEHSGKSLGRSFT